MGTRSPLIMQILHARATVKNIYGGGAKAWCNFLYYGLFRFNRFKILKADLEKAFSAERSSSPLTIHYPTAAELDALRSGRDLPREFHCDQFQKVSFCCIAKHDNELAYIHWIYRKGDFSRFLHIRDENAAEINYVITLPPYRGRGIATAAILDSMHTLKSQGIRYLYTVIHEENVASLKSFYKAGFEDFGSTVAFGILNSKVAV
ncbi:GNAT family N-acetyltransferase [Geomesophilobacter sediminis]|uniref:GNAT family N-acetyltransferase n=1 Tax=Geomesophilobacter sediminis TaxID=2798584 RepID=A0A8J7S9X4_9BACT|nr:GNAT family N-acetyltransferase [Geomesophilobacter sediminis]MBJ6727101.1 GNAT family N-acetyltransferase [Geomesophilobacter sediminis]